MELLDKSPSPAALTIGQLARDEDIERGEARRVEGHMCIKTTYKLYRSTKSGSSSSRWLHKLARQFINAGNNKQADEHSNGTTTLRRRRPCREYPAL